MQEETKWQQDAACALINSTNDEGYDVR
jgi:hypothetical protein